MPRKALAPAREALRFAQRAKGGRGPPQPARRGMRTRAPASGRVTSVRAARGCSNQPFTNGHVTALDTPSRLARRFVFHSGMCIACASLVDTQNSELLCASFAA
jgi:hypothetical protein